MWLIGGSLTKTHAQAVCLILWGAASQSAASPWRVASLWKPRCSLRAKWVIQLQWHNLVYVTVAFGCLECSYAKWVSGYFCTTFPRQTLKVDKDIIAAQPPNISIKSVLKLQMYCGSLGTFCFCILMHQVLATFMEGSGGTFDCQGFYLGITYHLLHH